MDYSSYMLGYIVHDNWNAISGCLENVPRRNSDDGFSHRRASIVTVMRLHVLYQGT